ncbi:hypothetical protein [Vibrio sp. M260118]|uniref:hypothetical protein n=1 Tax=Vibrio sp. M260118 TaxID=3020896 RepID=UPI003FCEC4F1
MDRAPDTQHTRGFALSIRAKLFLINATLLLFVALYGYVEHSSLQRLQSLEHASSQNLSSEVDLLMLRRHEKDFLARKDLKYPKRFDATFEKMSTRLDDLSSTLIRNQLNFTTSMETIKQTLNQYRIQFQQLVNQVNSIDGKDHDNSYVKQLEKARSELRQQAVAFNDSGLKVAVFELLESDFLYFSTSTQQRESELVAALDTFQTVASPYTPLSSYYDAYRASVNQLINARSVLGYSAEEGMRGQLRNNVHNTEQEISSLQESIVQEIEIATANVKQTLQVIGLAMVVLLSVLLFMIGRSILNRIRNINVIFDSSN